jgi:hypothetical protein
MRTSLAKLKAKKFTFERHKKLALPINFCYSILAGGNQTVAV